MKKIKLLSFTMIMLTISVLMVNCSKDKQLERALHKKEGEWNITSVTWEKVIQGTSGQSIAIGTTANAGTFTFEKDGSGTYNFTVDGTNYSNTFTWSVEEEVISIVKVSQSFDFSGNFDQLAIAMSGTQESKNKITLEGSETHQYSSGNITQSVIAGTFSLMKK